jgi:hypothetical protein
LPKPAESRGETRAIHRAGKPRISLRGRLLQWQGAGARSRDLARVSQPQLRRPQRAPSHSRSRAHQLQGIRAAFSCRAFPLQWSIAPMQKASSSLRSPIIPDGRSTGSLAFTATCDPRRAAAQARSIDVDQLRLLHRAMSRLERDRYEGVWIELTGDSTPPEIKALGAKAVRLDDIWPRVYLAGCVDNMTFLVFYGLRSGEKRIELLPGEVSPREVPASCVGCHASWSKSNLVLGHTKRTRILSSVFGWQRNQGGHASPRKSPCLLCRESVSS